MLEAGDHRREHDERDQQPDEGAERDAVLHARDDLADQQRLGERRRRTEDAEHRDHGERALVLEQEGQQLTERRARTFGGAAAAPTARGSG